VENEGKIDKECMKARDSMVGRENDLRRGQIGYTGGNAIRD